MMGWRRLFERTPPRFGQYTTWILCGLAIVLSCLPVEYAIGERQSAGTILGWLPGSVLEMPALMWMARAVLLISALCWAAHFGLPFSSWLTALSFTLVWSLRMENTWHAAHIFNATNMLLYVHAMWFQADYVNMKKARQQKRFWTSNLYPNWVFALSVFYLCWFHSWAGATKIVESGFDWGNGLSLQLWVYLWGWPASPTTQLILSSRTLTRLLQTGALIFETSAILGLFNRWLRWIVGFNLLGFYLGVLTTFVDYGFHANALLVALFLLPTRRFIEGKRNGDRSKKESQTASPNEAAA